MESQFAALASLIADLYTQITALQQENTQLHAALAAQPETTQTD